MKQFLNSITFQIRKACKLLGKDPFEPSTFTRICGSLLIFLFAGISVIKAQDQCDINQGWWKSKYLTLKSGIENGDTVHLNSCQAPLNISATDLVYYDYLKNKYCGKRLAVLKTRSIGRGYGYFGPCVKLKTFCYMVDLPEDAPEGMYQLWKYEYIVEDVYCQREYKLVYYLALYDHGAPLYQSFPRDTTIASAADLPAADEKVEIIDFCQYVAWWNVETEAVVDTTSGDTLCFVRTWSAGDPSGNESTKSQKIWINSEDDGGGQALRQFVSKSHSSVSDFKVYPNPSSNVIYIDIKSDDLLHFTVFDALGRLVKNGNFHQGQSINIDNLKAGVYHVQLQNQDQILGMKKILIMQ